MYCLRHSKYHYLFVSATSTRFFFDIDSKQIRSPISTTFSIRSINLDFPHYNITWNSFAVTHKKKIVQKFYLISHDKNKLAAMHFIVVLVPVAINTFLHSVSAVSEQFSSQHTTEHLLTPPTSVHSNENLFFWYIKARKISARK